jgi:hypothetical protein
MAVLQARYLRRDEIGQQNEDAPQCSTGWRPATAEPCRSFGEDAELWRERFRHWAAAAERGANNDQAASGNDMTGDR